MNQGNAADATLTEERLAFAQYRRKQIAELRPYVIGESVAHVSITNADKIAGSPMGGDMIARNPKNHDDQWLVAAQYFADNFEPIEDRRALPAPSGEMLADKLSAYIGKIRYVPDALLESAIAALRPCDESVMREVLAEEFDLVNLPQMAAATRDGEVLMEVRNNGYLGSLAPIFAALAAMQRVSRIAAPERIKAQGGE